LGAFFFEILSLFPLFPGDNELDQIHKIHSILGTPSIELLNQFKKNSTNMDFNFPFKQGTGFQKFLSHVTPECVDLISKLLCYNPEDRYSAKQALCHPYFKDLVEQENKIGKISNPNNPTNFMKSTFLNDSQSFIKSTDETQNQINQKNMTKKARKSLILT